MTNQPAPTRRVWASAAHGFACRAHVPGPGSGAGRADQWHLMGPNEQQGFTASADHPLECEACAAINDRAREHHVAIRANVDDWYARRIAHEEFEERARTLHEAARADGPEVEAALGRLIAASLPGVGAIQ